MSDTGSTRIAVIDTDSGFVQVLTKRLEGMGWQHRVLQSPPRVEEIVALRLNAIVVDVELLGTATWEYLDRVRVRLPALGVVVCTGRTTVSQRVRGLRLGADDWMTKPCHPEEVLARVEVAIRRGRRSAPPVEQEGVSAGELAIKPSLFQAFVGERSLDLTRREFEVLALLADSGGQVLEREQIYERVWGYAMVHGDRSVDVFVRKIRQKLEKASPGWEYIHTHFGVGYRFDARSRTPGQEQPDASAEPRALDPCLA